MSNYTDYRASSGFSAPSITWGVRWLILLTAACFVVQLILSPIMVVITGSDLMPYQTLPGGELLNTFFGFQPGLFFIGHIWKPFTYMFLHSGLMHLFMNMLWLYFFGCEVERALGSRQFLRFYILCGAIGVLATCIPAVLQGESVSVTGASGATMGVLIAFAMIDPERQFFMFPLPFPINARALVLIVIFLNIMSGLGDNNISVATHFGGMITGFLYMKAAPEVNRWMTRRRGGRAGVDPTSPDKVGEAVDNIFRFDGKRRR